MAHSTYTDFPHCNTKVALGGQIPLTAVNCDVSSGISTFPPLTTTAGSISTTILTTTARGSGPTSQTTKYLNANELSDGAIAGISIGTAFAGAAITLLAIVLWRRRPRTPVLQVYTPQQVYSPSPVSQFYSPADQIPSEMPSGYRPGGYNYGPPEHPVQEVHGDSADGIGARAVVCD